MAKVFHDRFKSEPLEDTERLLSILSFIYNDPVKANVVNQPEQYQWSSYNSYFYNGQIERCFISTNELLNKIAYLLSLTKGIVPIPNGFAPIQIFGLK